MIGLGPHTMSPGDWVLLAILQLSLLLFAAFALWLAIHTTRPRSGR
jgi:hypothetical protein